MLLNNLPKFVHGKSRKPAILLVFYFVDNCQAVHKLYIYFKELRPIIKCVKRISAGNLYYIPGAYGAGKDLVLVLEIEMGHNTFVKILNNDLNTETINFIFPYSNYDDVGRYFIHPTDYKS